MPSPDSIPVLNRLMAVLCRSLPQYLVYARPYLSAGSDEAVETLRQMAAEQIVMSERVSDLIELSERRIDLGRFPIEFTALHDLGIDYLIDRATRDQQRAITVIDRCADDLHLAPVARSLAEECLGMAKAHLESLEECVVAKTVAT